ncbi:MAG TPA: alpha/beta hydrolase [Gemmataceae bacterium]|nr:alpha/beta hydrolase [Gemmataceae bacterium]
MSASCLGGQEKRSSVYGFAAVLSLAGWFTAASAEESNRTEAFKEPGVQIIHDIAYRDLYAGEDGSLEKNKLDIYLPRGKKDFPVLFFVHGGAWLHGNKNQFGMYSALALSWARHGIGTVSINYRLSPGVKHPEHVKDVARAFAWTHKHIPEYGGRPDQIFVCGHSAGGHLVALLATDERYLQAEGLSRKDICGAIPISGVFRIHDVRVNAGVPLPRGARQGNEANGSTVVPPFSSVFGSDLAARREASPLVHVKAGMPPFLILYAEHDLPTLPEMAREFGAALKEQRCPVQALEIHSRNHMSILLNLTQEGDPAGDAILDFIAKHRRP